MNSHVPYAMPLMPHEIDQIPEPLRGRVRATIDEITIEHVSELEIIEASEKDDSDVDELETEKDELETKLRTIKKETGATITGILLMMESIADELEKIQSQMESDDGE